MIEVFLKTLAITLCAMLLLVGLWLFAHADPPNVTVISPQAVSTPHGIPPFPLQMGMLHYRCHRTPGGATIIEPIESTVPNGDTAIPIIFNCINCECGTEK